MYEHNATGAWSKTMIGYGPEEEGFALELTYNYGIDSYKNGDDLQHICLQRDIEATKAKAQAEGEREREGEGKGCLLYRSPSPRDRQKSRMPSSA